MSYPRTATPELLARIERVCRMRIAADAIPTDQQIADESGVRRPLVSRWMGAIRKALVAGGQPDNVSREACSDIEMLIEEIRSGK